MLRERKILICDGTRGGADRLRAELARRGASMAVARLHDPPEQSVAGASEELSGLDSVIVWPTHPPAPTAIVDLPADRWQEQLTLPLRGTVLLAREVLSHWLAEGQSGQLLVVHEVADAAAHQALDTALHALVRSVAKEYGRRQIRSNMIVGGPEGSASSRTIALAALVGLALSPAGSFVSGQRLCAGGATS